MANDNDSGGGTNALLNQVILSQSGFYKIVAQSHNQATFGPYTLSLTLAGADPLAQIRKDLERRIQEELAKLWKAVEDWWTGIQRDLEGKIEREIERQLEEICRSAAILGLACLAVIARQLRF